MSLRVGLISVLALPPGPNWQDGLPLGKLALPVLAGHLHASGWTRVRQYDLEASLIEGIARSPNPARWDLFGDDGQVDVALHSEGSPALQAASLLIDLLAIEPADVFGLSCANQSDTADQVERRVLVNLALCLAVELLRRWPGAAIVLGGIRKDFGGLDGVRYVEALFERCAALDYVVPFEGEVALVRILEHISGQRPLEPAAPVPSEDGDGSRGGGRERGVSAIMARDDVRGGVRGYHCDKLRVVALPEFDPIAFEPRRRTGREIMQRYGYTGARIRELADDTAPSVLLVPLAFMTGCSAACAFCKESVRRDHSRDVDEVVRAIAHLRERHDVRHFHFLNTNINNHVAYAHAFADALLAARLDILWSDSLNLRNLDEPLLEKLCRSGFMRALVGVETPSDRMLTYIGKRLTVREAVDKLALLDRYGVWTHAQFIVGMPTETPQDFADYLEFVRVAAPTINDFTVSPFYLVDHSLLTRFPERYGIELLGGGAFREIGGLDWEQKRAAIHEADLRLNQALWATKSCQQAYMGRLNLDLLFWLYSRLGVAHKARIVELYEEPFRTEEARGVASVVVPMPPTLSALARVLVSRGGALYLAGFLVDASSVAMSAEGLVVELVRSDERLTATIAVLDADGDDRPAFARSKLFAISYDPRTPPASEGARRALDRLAELARRVEGKLAP